MHPLEATLDGNFHHSNQQTPKRRSSLDNSALSAEETFKLSVIADIAEYGTSGRKRRYSLNSSENKITTFLAELLPARPKDKELDLDFHASSHHGSSLARRYASRDSSKLEDGTGGTQNTSLGDSLDISDSSMEDTSSGTFCDAEEGEPADRMYLQKDLGASCFWDDDFESVSEEEDQKPTKTVPANNERNQRIQAALDRVRKAKEKENCATD